MFEAVVWPWCGLTVKDGDLRICIFHQTHTDIIQLQKDGSAEIDLNRQEDLKTN